MPSKHEIQCQTGVHFLFIFDWYSVQLDIVHLEHWGDGQNPLSVMNNHICITSWLGNKENKVAVFF